MITSNTMRAIIQRHEGYRDTVYLDPVGHATIGYGHLVLPNESFPNKITKDYAIQLFNRDIRIAEIGVNKLVTVPLTQGQFDALVDFVFNLGQGKLAGSTLLRLLNSGDYDSAANQLHKWVFAGGNQLPGLVKRRQDAFDIWHGKEV